MTIGRHETYSRRFGDDVTQTKDSSREDGDDTPQVVHDVNGGGFPQKLMKRPRGPPPVKTSANGTPGPRVLPPIGTTRPKSPSSPAASSVMTLEEKQQRQMHSFLHNFLDESDTGSFQQVIDLHQHGIDTGITVTDATLQEVVLAVPNLRGLNLSGCSHITDAGLWAVARHYLCSWISVTVRS
ncbi:hypothetical protein PHYBOEH_002382 [Phytophthora boehmeriae]|uniref:Uncharacterized protein n=1 Tax=Phytophthora boehmeriae TaxID=109152 RepID=A0A8T1XA72_9STRA|nr:hypothetical protein PHYBOEH_002382 [Phytophthora boehmeriae]